MKRKTEEELLVEFMDKETRTEVGVELKLRAHLLRGSRVVGFEVRGMDRTTQTPLTRLLGEQTYRIPRKRVLHRW